ncbi:MATE family efflux transporter [Cohnella cholangitidis]|uniref:MATE family efflux transporter n=1 Tax=Cohnella cholangitidis TaxID=2598458 RepID=UPI0015F9948E|nr:MATE family efflux transporter [Cohnella cholangitidis]
MRSQSMEQENKLSLWHLSWPIGIELLLQFLMGAVDTVMVSRIGDEAVSAVGVSNQVIQSALTVFALINAGISVVVARKWGGGLREDARKTAVLGIQANLLMGIVGSLLFFFGTSTVLRYMNTPEDVVGYASPYLTFVGSMTVIVLLHFVINAVVRSTGNTQGPMYITIGMNVLHLLLNYVLIFGAWGFPEMGIQGAALSSMISRFAALLLSAWLLWRTFLPFWRLREWFKLEIPLLKEVLQVGLPVTFTAVSWGYSQIIVLALISRMGTTTLASYTYIQTIQQFTWMIAAAIGGGLQIRVGQFFGAGRLKEVDRSLGQAIRPGILLSLAVSALIFLLGTPIMRLFTSDPSIIDLSLPILAMCIVWQPLRVVGFCASNSLNIIGEAKYVAIITVIGMWTLVSGGTYVFGISAGFGLVGVMCALILDESFRSALFLLRWKRRSVQWNKSA